MSRELITFSNADDLLKYKNPVLKYILPKRFEMPLIKKVLIQLIYKEKYGTVTKLKLVKKKHNQKFKKHM